MQAHFIAFCAYTMACFGQYRRLMLCAALFVAFAATASGADIFLKWIVALDATIRPVNTDQPVITINGKFPGPLINATTNDFIHVNVFNNLDEPLLFTWNGIQQRLNSWQDGVSGTNCPIQPGTNWTYVFQTKDQIGSFFYFPSINFHKAAGGFGPIRVNNRNVIATPFAQPEAEYDLLVGDWYSADYRKVRVFMGTFSAFDTVPDVMLINGNGPFGHPLTKTYGSFTVKKGKTYRLRISNVGTAYSFNFKIQNHKMVLVETEGSYTNQMTLESLDVHVGQSYSVLVTADQDEADYYIVASPILDNKMSPKEIAGVGVLHYADSSTKPKGPIPRRHNPSDLSFSMNQAKSIRWNLTAGAARPNPQGTFNVSHITLSQTFILEGSKGLIGYAPRYAVNNVTYSTPSTPLKLADYFVNGTNVYELDWFPTHSVNNEAAYGVSVVSGKHKGWIELVFVNMLDVIDSWHLDGFGFYVVGLGMGKWSYKERKNYNLYDPVVRSTVQVYPGGWTAVYAFLDNPGMWNLRSQSLRNWFLGQELYIRVHNPDPNPVKERPSPKNLLYCGIFKNQREPRHASGPIAIGLAPSIPVSPAIPIPGPPRAAQAPRQAPGPRAILSPRIAPEPIAHYPANHDTPAPAPATGW